MSETAAPKAFDPQPMPAAPPAGWWASLRYSVALLRARRERQRLIVALNAQVAEHVGVLDGVLRTLGQSARDVKLELRSLAEENAAITAAQERRAHAEKDFVELNTRRADETSKHRRIHSELGGMAAAREQTFDRANEKLQALDAEQRACRAERKDVEKEQRRLAKAADARDEQAARGEIGEKRDLLRESAAQLRAESEALNARLAEINAKLETLEGPHREAVAAYEAAKEERDAARRALDDAREGHRQQLADFESEQTRRSKEVAAATAEIERRLITLGTLVNLERTNRSELRDIYTRIDELKATIQEREALVDTYRQERGAYDKGALLRGAAVVAGAVIVVMTIAWVLWAVW